jgi:polyhydroxyalkanoate synthase
MSANPYQNEPMCDAALTPLPPALQQLGPRPLPLFLDLLQKQAAVAPLQAELALLGLKRIQALRVAPATIAAPAVAQYGRACLHDYGGSGPAVIFVPSLINPATILDILPERSLLRWLSTQGLHPYLVDWGTTDTTDADLSIGDHVSERLSPLIASVPGQSHLVGYCLGGTMALAAAQQSNVRSLTLIASPWHFSRYPDQHRAAMKSLWETSRPLGHDLGVLPIEVLQTLFWHLDPAGTVSKYANFANAPSEGIEYELFAAMEAWANTGAPLPYAAACELFDDFIANDLPGTSRWNVAGQIIAPKTIQCPALEIVSLTDNIVPAATATQCFNRLEIDRGHVGMITGSQAKPKLWEPLREWLSRTEING